MQGPAVILSNPARWAAGNCWAAPVTCRDEAGHPRERLSAAQRADPLVPVGRPWALLILWSAIELERRCLVELAPPAARVAGKQLTCTFATTEAAGLMATCDPGANDWVVVWVPHFEPPGMATQAYKVAVMPLAVPGWTCWVAGALLPLQFPPQPNPELYRTEPATGLAMTAPFWSSSRHAAATLAAVFVGAPAGHAPGAGAGRERRLRHGPNQGAAAPVRRTASARTRGPEATCASNSSAAAAIASRVCSPGRGTASAPIEDHSAHVPDHDLCTLAAAPCPHGGPYRIPAPPVGRG